MNKQYLIIGASAAGIGCALRLRMLDAEATIMVLTAESDWPYNKCNMADVLLGEKPLDEITFCNEAMLGQKKIELVRDARVIAIDSEQKSVRCTNRDVFGYDFLCVATGKSPRMLPLFEDKKFSNLFNFYYKNDLEQIISYISTYNSRSAIVIGAGLTGLEAADGLRSRGLQVTIVEATSQLLPSLINEYASQFIIKKIKETGAAVITGEKIAGYAHEGERLNALQLSSGKQLHSDLMVCAIGAASNTRFLPSAIELRNGYAVIDEYMQTSIPGIYAAGDCCLVYDQLIKRVQPNALWPDAMQQGMYAAYGMAGVLKKYPGSVSIASSSFFGIKVAIAGPVIPEVQQHVTEQESDGYYHRLLHEREKLVGFMLIGNTTMLSDYRRQLLSQ
jgi:NAD(P)H-nitrite reductase large subunit